MKLASSFVRACARPAFAILVAACGSPPAPPVATAPRRTPDASPVPAEDAEAPAPPAVDAGADATASAEPPGPAWTDPEHVEALARDCAYAPKGSVRPKDVERDFWEGSPLACSYGLYGQSCSVDPCFDEQKDVCGAKCERTCDGCGAQCTSACTACKKGCKKGDAACARTCAVSCAGCKQECVLARDRCSSGTCTKRYEACKIEMQAKWDSGGCGKGCKAYYACANDCPEAEAGPGGKCAKGCEKHLKACSAAFRSACLFNGGLYGPVGAD